MSDEDCIAFSSSKLRYNMSQKLVVRFRDYVLQLWIFYTSDNLYFYFMVTNNRLP